MEDLSQSAFFDDSRINIIRLIIQGSKAPAISGKDVEMISRREEIVSINKEMDRQLVRHLEYFKKCSGPYEVVNFLITANLIDILPQAIKFLETCAEEGLSLDNSDFESILEELKETPPNWVAQVFSTEIKDRQEKKVVKESSSLNLDKLNNFK